MLYQALVYLESCGILYINGGDQSKLIDLYNFS